MKIINLLILFRMVAGLHAGPAPSWNAPPEAQREGVFWRLHGYDRASDPGAGKGTRRLRINAPETSLHPNFGRRKEARENGLMLIQAEEDLFRVTAVEFHAELWGGHPGTINKRITVNGRTTYPIPEVGAASGHCTYSYPVIPLKRTDLVNGFNAVQWALDRGETFWGHAMVDAACLRYALEPGHPDLKDLGLEGFTARIEALALTGDCEGFRLSCDIPEPWRDLVERVDVQAWYLGYDENGDGRETDWHGYTFQGEPRAWIGGTSDPAEAIDWDTRMIAAQDQVALRARVSFKEQPGLVYWTPALRGLDIRKPPGVSVLAVRPKDLPEKFWSRAGRKRSCTLDMALDGETIEAAVLHVRSWTGGAGTVQDYFTLNGKPFPVAEGSAHEVQYSRLKVEPGLLHEGSNRIELLSDTEHHGIEILLPGPALMLRLRH